MTSRPMKQIGSLSGEARGEFAASFVGQHVAITHKYLDNNQRGRVVAVASVIGGHTDYVLVLARDDGRVLAFPLATLRRIDKTESERI